MVCGTSHGSRCPPTVTSVYKALVTCPLLTSFVVFEPVKCVNRRKMQCAHFQGTPVLSTISNHVSHGFKTLCCSPGSSWFDKFYGPIRMQQYLTHQVLSPTRAHPSQASALTSSGRDDTSPPQILGTQQAFLKSLLVFLSKANISQSAGVHSYLLACCLLPAGAPIQWQQTVPSILTVPPLLDLILPLIHVCNSQILYHHHYYQQRQGLTIQIKLASNSKPQISRY